MKTSQKALLLSALVFPGAGLWLLNCRLHASVYIITAMTATAVIMLSVFRSAKLIVDRVVSGELPAEMTVIRQLVKEQQASSIAPDIALAILVICWLAGIIDTHRIARQINAESN